MWRGEVLPFACIFIYTGPKRPTNALHRYTCYVFSGENLTCLKLRREKKKTRTKNKNKKNKQTKHVTAAIFPVEGDKDVKC